MANVLTENPWSLDGSVLNEILVANQIKVKQFEYTGYASGDSSTVTLLNRFGQVVWQVTGNTTGDVQRSAPIGWIYGLQESVHTDGVILVYFD